MRCKAEIKTEYEEPGIYEEILNDDISSSREYSVLHAEPRTKVKVPPLIITNRVSVQRCENTTHNVITGIYIS